MVPANNATVPAALTSKTGNDFDQAFARMGVEDHEKDIKEFEKEANSGSDPDVKSWAIKTLPTLKARRRQGASSVKSTPILSNRTWRRARPRYRVGQ